MDRRILKFLNGLLLKAADGFPIKCSTISLFKCCFVAVAVDCTEKLNTIIKGNKIYQRME